MGRGSLAAEASEEAMEEYRILGTPLVRSDAKVDECDVMSS